jgi:glucan 1,3-beta-glucosidase
VFAGQIQSETAYYQPNPNARIPFPHVSSISDPPFNDEFVSDQGITIPAANGWGLRIVDSTDIQIYGAGLYSFFDNQSTACSNQGNSSRCQNRIFSVEGSGNTRTSVYNLNTVGTHWPISVDGSNVAYYNDNQDGFVQTIALFRNRGGV